MDTPTLQPVGLTHCTGHPLSKRAVEQTGCCMLFTIGFVPLQSSAAMGWQSEERVKLVRELRQAAKACGVPQVPDNAGQAKVRKMAEAVLATTGAEHANTRKQVTKTLNFMRLPTESRKERQERQRRKKGRKEKKGKEREEGGKRKQ